MKFQSMRPPQQDEIIDYYALESKYLHPWRRLFARTLDLLSLGFVAFYALLYLIGLILGRLGILTVSTAEEIGLYIQNPLFAGFLLYLSWIFLEAISFNVTGTTPGKWIYGIRVKHFSGNNLTLISSLKRSILVWIHGEALGIPFIIFFTRISSYNRLKRTGSTHWDDMVNSVVVHEKWSFSRLIGCIISWVLVMFILCIFKVLGGQ